MIDEQLRARAINDPKVIEAMAKIPRELFVPLHLRSAAYWDCPLPIGRGQTISQPYIVALMTEELLLRPRDTVLEIGTGSGYQTAILAELVEQVYSAELIPELGLAAQKLLLDLGYTNINIAITDGHQGWIDSRLFDAILVTAAPTEMPQKLLESLKIGGRMVIPIGDDIQELYRIERHENGFVRHNICGVRFVPMKHRDGVAEV
jgi:protein-L-isoaspartate(D-aspartate) O-methyltransferase